MVECRIRGGRADRGVDGRRRLASRGQSLQLPHQHQPQPRTMDGQLRQLHHDLSDGKTEVEFQSVDVAGNTSAWSAPVEVWLDHTAPTLAVTPSQLPTASGWNNSATTVTAVPNDTGSGNVVVSYRLTTSGSGTPGASVSFGSAGKYLVEFQAKDAVGNTSAWTAPTNVWLDFTLPAAPTSLSGGLASWRALASVAITPNGASDPGANASGVGCIPLPNVKRRHHMVGAKARTRNHLGGRDHVRSDGVRRQRRKHLDVVSEHSHGGQHRHARHHWPDQASGQRWHQHATMGRYAGDHQRRRLDRRRQRLREQLPVRDLDQLRRHVVWPRGRQLENLQYRRHHLGHLPRDR